MYIHECVHRMKEFLLIFILRLLISEENKAQTLIFSQL